MKETISIIVPIYNVEHEIHRCIDSILKQTYPYYEIIIIDDGSTDKSFDVCKNIADIDKRVKIYRQQNMGVSAARNNGLRNATGDWIFFVDGDDYLPSDALSIAISKASTGIDVVDFNYCRVDNNGKKIFNNNKQDWKEDYISYIKNVLLYNRTILKPILYRKNLLNNVYFDLDVKIGEDLLFSIDVIKRYGGYIYHVNKPIYYYYQRENSAMHSGVTCDKFTLLNVKVKHLLADNLRFKMELKLFYCINEYFRYLNDRNCVNKLNYERCFKDLTFTDFLNRNLASKFKILFLAFRINRHLGNAILYLRSHFIKVH